MTPLLWLLLALAATVLLARLRAPFVLVAAPLVAFGVVATWKGVRS